MMPIRHLAAFTVLVATGAATAQGGLPRLRVPAVSWVVPGSATDIQFALTGLPSAAYALFADVSAGPVLLLGERLQLGLTPALTLLASGTLPSWGHAAGSIAVGPSATLLGRSFHLQAIVLDAGSPNGLFAASNAESTVLLVPVVAIVERFDAPAVEGFVGSYDSRVTDRLEGGPVQRRTQRSVPAGAAPFAQPLGTPLVHHGSRLQSVVRARELQAQGDEELVTALRWRPFGGSVVADRFDRFELWIAHSDVVPDYSIDVWSQLPRFPNSGLDPVFANNVAAGEQPQQIFSGSYAFGPADLRADGYVDFPIGQAFVYDGLRSLLLDFRVAPSTTPGSGANGQIVWLNVLSSPQPNARVFALGTPGAPLDPHLVTSGRGDNTSYDFQIELTRVKTVAVSPWRAAGLATPDYDTPIRAVVEPRGTSITVEFRGADDASGSGSTPWSTQIDAADGKGFLQFRFTFVGDPRSGAVPAIDSLVVPVR